MQHSHRSALAGLCCVSLVLGLALSTVSTAALQEEVVVVAEFYPEAPSYKPGQDFSVNFTVMNAMANNSPYTPVVKVIAVSAYFGWMGASERVTENVSDSSPWLYPSELGVFSLAIEIPENAVEKTYTYFLEVWYQYEILNSGWGIIEPSDPWRSVVYRDLTVAEDMTDGEITGGSELLPAIALFAVILATMSVAVVAYFGWAGRGAKKEAPRAGIESLAVAEAPAHISSELPVIRASPGERFPIEKGFVYLVKEKRPGIAFAMFSEAVKHGASGMLVVREHPNRLKQQHEFEAAKILWLTRRVGQDHIDPTELSLLTLQITKFVEGHPKSVLLIEGIEYLITQNDFESVLRFTNHLHDFVLAHDCAVIIVLDPRVLSTREVALLERSARIVEPGDTGVVRPDRLAEELDK